MLVHDCTRQVGLFSFIETRNNADKSGWFLDYFFNTQTTDDEKLAFRDFIKGNHKPLLYVGACLPPNLVKAPEETLNLTEIVFPTIKAEAKITGCDVDEGRVNNDGTIVPVGRQRFDKEMNRQMAALLEGLRLTHISEAILVLKEGGYVLNSQGGNDMGTIDFNRDVSLKNIDLSGTADAWSNKCAKPIKSIESIVRLMAKQGAGGGVIDIVYSDYAWEWMEGHSEREATKFDRAPHIATSFDASLYLGYDDVVFKGSTNGGTLRHWVSYAQYVDHTGAEVDVLDAGEILIVNKSALGGTRMFRTVTSDNRETLPAGATFFLYDDLEKEYNRKCRSFSPWLEEYHLMLARNVNGATKVRVVAANAGDVCVECQVCPT